MNQQPKKLVIRSLKGSIKPHLPEDFERTSWNRLSNSLIAIEQCQPVSDSFEELYRLCENLCLHKLDKNLYTRLKEHLQAQMQRKAEDLKRLALDTSISENDFLNHFNDCWSKHCRQTVMIRSIFLYLDRTFALQHPGLQSIWDLNLKLFREAIISDNELSARIVHNTLSLIHKDREGQRIDKSLCKAITTMFRTLETFAELFLPRYLVSTENYYSQLAISLYSRLNNDQNIFVHLELCERLLSEEQERHEACVGDNWADVKEIYKKQMLQNYLNAILNSWQVIWENENLDSMKRLWRILSLIENGKKAFLVKLGELIQSLGVAIVQDELNDHLMIKRLLELREKVDRVLLEAFEIKSLTEINAPTQSNNKRKVMDEDSEETLLLRLIMEAFEKCVNSRRNKPAEMIAKYIDEKLRLGNKIASDQELDLMLNQAIILFRLIQGKDVFEAFYKRDLAKRLLLNRSASFDAERSMLLRLRNECGPGFTNKLEGMFKDMEISADVATSFHHSRFKNVLSKNIEFAITVLTQGYWPTYTPVSVELPLEIIQHQEAFEKFYTSNYQGKKLQWHHSLVQSTIIMNLANNVKKELLLNAFQSVVLLCFNTTNKPELSYIEIRNATCIVDDVLKRTLQSMACGKFKVLNKKRKSRDVSENDEFSVNLEFTSPHYRIRIPTIQPAQLQEDEDRGTMEKVFQDRQYQVDAAIVRVMKTRKRLNYQALTAAVLEQLRFPIQASDLKKRLESLMERDYIERDEEDLDIYRYLA